MALEFKPVRFSVIGRAFLIVLSCSRICQLLTEGTLPGDSGSFVAFDVVLRWWQLPFIISLVVSTRVSPHQANMI